MPQDCALCLPGVMVAIDNHADRQSMEQFVMLLDGHTPDCIEAEP